VQLKLQRVASTIVSRAGGGLNSFLRQLYNSAVLQRAAVKERFLLVVARDVREHPAARQTSYLRKPIRQYVITKPTKSFCRTRLG
jgi:hypothetical protein